MSWNPITATPDCDWCGACEWCDNLHRDYANCTCGHYYASEHEDGTCLITGCGCGAV